MNRIKRGVVCRLGVCCVLGLGSLAASSVEPAAALAAQGGARNSRAVMFVGFDGSPPLVTALKRGQLQGVVMQNPYLMGHLSVRTLVDHLEGKPIEKREISTGEVMVTPENMDKPEIAALLNPPKLPHSADSNLTGPKAKKWRVMVIPKGTTHEHWKTIHAGAVKAAEELGTVEIIWQGPQKEDDRSAQIALVESAIAARVDGIVLAPLDAKTLVKPVERAIAQGIPVVIMDSRLQSDKPIAYVATDNYRGGVLAGERLAEVLGGKGRIILMRYAVGSAATEEREQGFIDAIKKHPGITFLSDNQYAGSTSDSAQRVAQTLVVRYRNQIDGVFCPNESSTAGMLRSLMDANLLPVRR